MADPTLETPVEIIRVTGIQYSPHGSSWTVSCRASECSQSADSVGAEIDAMLKKAVVEFQEVEEVVIDMCNVMSSLTPSICYQYSSISSPAVYIFKSPTYWSFPPITNGCGAGSLGEAILTKVTTGVNGFTGDLDQPLPNVSFTSACNSHDICYGSQNGESNCDDNFFNDLVAICAGDSNCQTFAHTYRAAVGHAGSGPYSDSGQVKQCKEFKADFKANCSGTDNSP